MKIEKGLSEGQVLQRLGNRGAKAQIEGSCPESGEVRATLSGVGSTLKGWKNRVAGKSRGGRFSAALKDIPPGGPYRLELRCGRAAVRVGDFFVGDVWLLAGQSNMEGVGDMTGAARPHPLVRAFTMAREWMPAADPLHVLSESPDFCHSAGAPLSREAARLHRRQAKKGVGPGIFFAREMVRGSGVPQGLLCTAHGGTSMTQWDPARKHEGGASLYGSMLLSVRATGQPVAGVLWYQGESDANETDRKLYTERMKKLVAATRRDLKTPNLPWLVVQIARVFGIGIDVRSWNQIQEEQRRLPDRIKNLETVAAIDLPLDDGIHISALGYPRLGARLARAADRLVYGNKKEPAAPRLRRIELSEPGRGSAERRIEVEFDGIVGGLRAAGEPHGFSLVQSDGTPWPFCYKITLKGDRVRLHVGRLMDGMMLHYGHGSAPVCNITDARDMSLPVFGPLPVSRPRAYLPFVNQWLVTDPVASEIPLHRVACPDPAALGAVARTYGVDGFINEHPRWMGKSGHGYFSSRIELPEAMKLQVLLGYDGPFRLWIDGKSVFTDMNGINPCLPDAVARPVALAAGVHRITVGMDLNQGRAWGFMLRFVRQDVSAAQIAAKSFAVPAYLPVE